VAASIRPLSAISFELTNLLERRSSPLAEQLPSGRLIEIASDRQGAQMTAAVACLRHAQARGETSAWVQPRGGSLYPPDLADSGIDLEALTVIHVPETAGPLGPARAVELLLRSGGFGLVVLDLSESRMGGASGGNAWQGRLLGLAREHSAQVILLSDRRVASLGPLVSLSIAPVRRRVGRGLFELEPDVRKDKSGLLGPVSAERRRGPWGLL
jgi:recombination protein RecA